MAHRKRLGDLLIERGMMADAHGAFVAVTEGRVFINGQKAVSPAEQVRDDADIVMRPEREYVGRGAYKLVAALDRFPIAVEGAVAADVGSATGGFVEVLLKRGALKVYAIDTARGKLDPKVREDARVIVMEGTDARSIAALPEPMDIVSMDVSLIPLRRMLPPVRGWLRPGGSVIALLKPQYEARPEELRHGIVRDDATRERIVSDIRAWLGAHGWREEGMMASPIRGSEGNTEYLFHLTPRRDFLRKPRQPVQLD